MASLSSLAKRARKIEAELPDRVNELTIDTTLQLAEQLAAIETPVDTSQALSNWQVGVGGAPRSFIPPHSPGKAGSSRATSASRVVALARSALSGRKVGQVIYLSNNAPYIRKLAYEGHSTQAPPGWVEGSVLLARKFIRRVRSRLLK